MPEQVFLTIDTDNPDEAIGDALCCARTNMRIGSVSCPSRWRSWRSPPARAAWHSGTPDGRSSAPPSRHGASAG
jgi:hypothetical protein